MEIYWNRFRQYPLATQIMIGATVLLYLGWLVWLPFRDRTPSDNANQPAANQPVSADLESLIQNSPALSLDSLRVFEIDISQSSASYIVDEEFLSDSGQIIGRNTNAGFNTAIGTTQLQSGTIVLDFANNQPTLILGEFSADMLGLTSIQPHRDGMLKRFWLESNRYPSAHFKSSGSPALVLPKQNEVVTFALDGSLTVRDVTRPVSFDVEAILNGDTLSGNATAIVKMSDFGISPPVMANVVIAEDDVKIEVELVAVEMEDVN